MIVKRAIAEQRRWSDVFHRSRLSPFVFVVASTDEADVYETVADLGLPKVESRGVFQHWIEAWPLLDGAVTGISTEGFAPELPSGLRVLGHNPVRLLCHLMGMDPPRRALSGETAVPSVDDLLSRLATQREGGDADELTEQAKIAMVSRVFGLLNAVRVLFGDEAVDQSRAKPYQMPGTGAWGEAQFNRRAQEILSAAGVDPAQAAQWSDLGANVDEILACHHLGADKIEPWLSLELPVEAALELVTTGRSTKEVKPYLKAGVWAGCIAPALTRGLTPRQCVEYQRNGFAWSACEDMIRAGISPSEASLWKGVSDNGWTIVTLAKHGVLPEEAKALKEAGIDLHQRAGALAHGGG